MSKSSLFKLYNASAGSGKTFNLVKEYLVLLLNSEDIFFIRKILSITFTNKAVKEKKRRILDYLADFSQGNFSDKNMTSLIFSETNLNKDEVQKKSLLLLKNILKNYNSFEISTIDKFTQKVIKGFNYELGISNNYEIELDEKEFLDRAVDNLIDGIKEKKELLDKIISYSEFKSENQKSWDVIADLQNTSRLLINEQNFSEIQNLDKFNLDDFNKLEKKLKSDFDFHKTKAKEVANEILKEILKEVSFLAFSRQTIPNHFKKITSGEIKNLYKSKMFEHLSDTKLYHSKVNEIEIEKIEKIKPKIIRAFNDSKSHVHKALLCENILNNLIPLSVLNLLKDEIEKIKKEGNLIPISEFNKIIHKEIKNQPVPFIYEKIGSKYSHYFIDEFQDTSKLQWNNILPLIENSLASENSMLLISGDPKQSIYRWRGSEVNEYLNIIKSNNLFQCRQVTTPLKSNYRSGKAIVEFNNGIFQKICKNFPKNKLVQEIYKDAVQTTKLKFEGFVQVVLSKKKTIDELRDFYNLKTLEIIKNVISRGYSLEDICILVRKKKEGLMISKYLIENNVPVISSDTLNISSSPEVNLIIELFKFTCNNSKSTKMKILGLLLDLKVIDHCKEDFMILNAEKNLSDILKNQKIDFELNKFKNLSIYEAVEYVIYCFHLGVNGTTYIISLLDFVNESTYRHNNNFNSFLELFESKEESLNVISSENTNAVEILTIHKSKGLEFPVVIFPFADISINSDLKPKAWIDVDSNQESSLNRAIINLNVDIKEINSKIYQQHKDLVEIDNLNILYVTLTRAKEELYVLANEKLTRKGDENLNYFSGQIISYLKSIECYDTQKNSFGFGVLQKKIAFKKENETLIPNGIYFFNARSKNKIDISEKNFNRWLNDVNELTSDGTIFHNIMSKIKYQSEILKILESFYVKGKITKTQRKEFESKIKLIFKHEKLKKYFQSELKSFNEREILTKSGKILIPDKLVFLERNKVALIDYKTGKKNNAHKQQLNVYEEALKNMGIITHEKVLIYTDEKIEVEIFK
jgi:ATP-dependent exoDNAse (exonuclease V) beta subunit